ncbi:MAG: hypothetical protein TE42_01410 [Candidatus Synechococcus spongiarum SP3]|uniref:Probable aspartoacylase n=1 Tax=Candidatus Synechococcus spongiarum SP3 TaxID=1604020 RepID=A0A0G2HNL0_9SYNE|nr:MAG: hypothetical protein TE42_01410 [Candidatus Synechococcus spongiarum SP3]
MDHQHGRLLVVGGTHGNERTAPWILQCWEAQPALFASPLPTTNCIGNPEAYGANRRYMDRDLNRCFTEALLRDRNCTVREVSRARELVDTYGPNGKNPHSLVLDLHTTTAAMGSSVVVCGERPVDLALAALVHQAIGIPIYLFRINEEHPEECGFLVRRWPCGLVLEVGPVAQGIVDMGTVRKTAACLESVLAVLGDCLRSKAKLPESVVVHRHLASLDWPRDGDGRRIAGLHPDRSQWDWTVLLPGDPLFLMETGETIAYQGEEPVWPVFCNEASYEEKGIALSLTQREIKTPPADGLEALLALLGS